MTRDSLVRYESFSKAINILPEANQLNAYRFIIDYGLYGKEPEQSMDPVAYALFLMARPQIDANTRRFLNGCKGGRPKSSWNNSEKPTDNQKQSIGKPNVNENVNENANTNENDNENKNINKIAYSEDFESFRKAYPKKKGKQKAREAWENAIKGGNDPKHLINKAGEYATEVKLKRIEETFVKFAQGWLNDGRFDDDYFTGNKNEKPDLEVLY